MSKSRVTPVLIFSLLIMMFITVSAPSAAASSLQTLNLTQSEAFGSGNYGTVKLTLISGTIQVIITITNGTIVDTGAAHSAVTFNIEPNSNISISGLSTGYALANTTPGAFSQTGFFGTYEFAITGPGPSDGNRVPSLTFVVSRTSGSFSNVEELISNPNPAGSSPLAATWTVDILQGAPCTGACTGIVGTGNPPVQTPEPTSIMLIGAGLTGLAMFRRRFSKN